MTYEEALYDKTEIEYKNEEISPAPGKFLYLYLALSFLLPILIMGTAFALHKVYPFGGRQILVSDFWQQYYPFLSDYLNKLREGGSLLWSWTVSADYLGSIAYYLASPLNLLLAFVPHAWLREALTAALLIKLGFAGLFFSLYLRYACRECGPASPVFASLYALCAFTQGYYANIIWFDSFALLPLVMLGVEKIVREDKFALYVVSLASAVLFNYLMGFFICIFVAVTFLGLCVTRGIWCERGRGRGEFVRKLVLIFACTAVALGLTAWLTFPAYSSLQNTYSMESAFPSELYFYRKFSDILGNFIAFAEPTVREGLPNVYSGMISVLLAAAFVYSPKVSFREKMISLGVMGFLILSCNLNALDYIWHGFHFTNMVPFRFSFLISFALVVMAYRGYLMMKYLERLDIAIMGVTAVLFLTMAAIRSQGKYAVAGSAVLCAAYLLILGYPVFSSGAPRLSKLLKISLLLIALAEVSAASYIGVKTNRTTDRASYPNRYDQVQRLLDMRGAEGFFRTEIADWYTLNDASLYGFDGISFFSSSASANVTRFMEGLGLPAWKEGNRYYYAETSPLTSAFLNMRYTISRGGRPADGEVYWKQAGRAGGSLLLENGRYLPLGFMVGEDAADYAQSGNPFLSQNDLFRRATGLDGLFTLIDAGAVRTAHVNYDAVPVTGSPGDYTYSLKEGSSKGTLEWRYEMPADGMLYVYCKIDGAQDPQNSSNIRVSARGGASRSVNIRRPYLFTAGKFSRGDVISISASLSDKGGGASVYAGCLNGPLFDRGFALLADEPLTLTKVTETEITGSVTALRDGLLYTSIPNEKRWAAYVDGAEAEVALVGGCMTAIRLNEGTHKIEFRYRNGSFTAGVIVSAISLAAFAALMGLRRRLMKH